MAQSVENKKNSGLFYLMHVTSWLAMLIFACHACTHMVGAGDTWVAMACGRHFLNHGVDTVEPFSANSHKAGPTAEEIARWPKPAKWIAEKVGIETVKYWHPTGWINQNWLTHVMFYWLSHKSPIADAENFSYNSLVYWKFAIYIIAAVCVYYTGRILGVHFALSAFFTCAAMFIGRSFLDIRPAGFSNMLTAVFLLILALSVYRNILYIWLIVPLAVFWCNVHGGYLYIFIMLVPFVFFNFITIPFKNRFVTVGPKGLYHVIAAGITAFIGMIIFNPFHLTNLTHTFVISISKHAEMWRSVNEWHPAWKWNNPVGTSFPFLVMFLIGIFLFLLWLYSRFMVPDFAGITGKKLERGKSHLQPLLKIFTCLSAVFISWCLAIAFSFLNLDTLSFLICALFTIILLLSILKNIYFIFSVILLTLIALLVSGTKSHYDGRYIYPFIILPAYIAMHIMASLISKQVKLKQKNIGFVILAAAITLILMLVLINPFRVALAQWNEAAFSRILQAIKSLAGLYRPWSPAYEGNYKPDYTYLFEVLYIVNIVSVAVWFVFPYLRKFFGSFQDEYSKQARQYSLPKIDLSFMAIAIITIYMAISSRRFIPIAAIVSCPVIAVLITQTTCTILALIGLRRENSFSVKPMSYGSKLFISIAGGVAVLFFCTFWTIKFKQVYLDPWPTDPKFTSVFMRMTASAVKPFYACQFIRDNKLSGRMFNYWTEGGFIAYGQNPDPETGKIPLQLFMDGRAQAAYERDKYMLWSNIMGGGPAAKNAHMRGRKLTKKDYEAIGKWVDEQLKKYNVWVVLMTTEQDDSAFVNGLEHVPDWHVVFLNNKQKMLIDRTSPQGKKLFEDMFVGGVVYPDEFTESIMIAHNMFLFGKDLEAKKEALKFAIRAFNLNPSHIPMKKIIYAMRFTELRPEIDDFCRNYLGEFEEKKQIWAKQNAFAHKVSAAFMAASYLQEYGIGNDKEKLEYYDLIKRQCLDKREELVEKSRW